METSGVDQQSALAGLLGTSTLTLEQALETVADWVKSDPAKARQGATLIFDLAQQERHLAIAAQASYLQAQTHAIDADFPDALQLIDRAHQLYQAAGLETEALRTNIGRIHVLKELGQYQLAQDTALGILQRLADPRHKDSLGQDQGRQLIAAMAYQNLGVCLEQTGQYEEALDAYAMAEAQYRVLGRAEHSADILNNRGVILLKLGQTTQALQVFEEAQEIYTSNKLKLKQALALANIGNVHIQRGNYIEGLADLQLAIDELASIAAEAERQSLLLDMAETYLSLNLYAEARAAFQEMLDFVQHSGMVHEQARTLWGSSMALIGLGQHEAAAHALEQAAQLFSVAGNVPMLGEVRLQQSVLSERSGHINRAYDLAQHAYQDVLSGHWPLQRVRALLRLAALILQAPTVHTQISEADNYLAQAKAIAGTLDLSAIQMHLQHLLGRAALARGDINDARHQFSQALNYLERERVYLGRVDWRASFLVDKSEIYTDWIQLLMRVEENVVSIFDAIEQAKSRALLDLLTVAAADSVPEPPHTVVSGSTTPTLPATNSEPVTQRLAILQTQLDQVYDQLMSTGLEQEDRGQMDFAALQAKAITIEQSINQLRLHSTMATRSEDAIGLPHDLNTVQTALDDDSILLNYCLNQGQVAVLVITKGSIQLFRNIALIEDVQSAHERLTLEWRRFEVGNDFVRRHLPQMERSVLEPLRALHDALIAPLVSAMGGKREHGRQALKLVIVPHALLHQVPFHALYDGSDYLVDWCEISYAPSASVFAICQKHEKSGLTQQCAFGVVDPSIPLVEAEIQAIGQTLPNCKTFLNAAATLAAVKAQAPNCSLLHLACHGRYRGDNPMFSALKLHDGWLNAYTLQTFHLSASLVVLSACESGLGTIVGNDDILGLTRAILGAGAAALLASLWLVADVSTATLMQHFYSHLQAGHPPATALRLAQCDVKAQFPHPFYWASFVLIGKRR